ncbi:MAG: 50S ribosomal protein L2 [Desulfurococcales archaeon]|nr:50S ribosomal protein L2 [Desulfurococcales archaeon]
MGKRLRQQRAGRGSPTYRSPGHIHPGPARYPPPRDETIRGKVVELLHDPGRYVPLARVVTETGEEFLTPAAEGMYVGQFIEIGPDAKPEPGNILPLGQIPEGTMVYNLELQPGDGGRLARQAGSYAVILGKSGARIRVRLPSGKEKDIIPTARATIGIPAGAGRIEKPLLKAGNAYHKWKVKARKWPRVRGVAMNAVNHPFGGGSHQRKSHPSTVARETPPGRKVGHIAARRTGRRKR